MQAKKTFLASDKKSVHSLRVTVRRLRAVLWLGTHSSPRLSFKSLPSMLRKLGQALGKLRDLDVAIQDSSNYHMNMKSLIPQRILNAENLLHQVDPKNVKQILFQLDKALEKLQKHPELDLNAGLLMLRGQLNPWLKKNKIRDNQLHKLRIFAKKTRYTLEAVGKPVRPLKKLQNLLGRGHDLEVLQDLLGKNVVVKSDEVFQYQKAKRVIKPALHFAIKQLKITH